MGIYNLYVTRSRLERKYFYSKVIKPEYFIVHMDFRYDQIVRNIKTISQQIPATVYFNGKVQKVILTNFQDLINLFKSVSLPGPTVFVYSGHSDGMYLAKNNIRPLRIEDFADLIKNTVGTCELIIFDCCLCGNLYTLDSCKYLTKYILAATSYWSFMSVLELDNLITLSPIEMIKGMLSLEHEHRKESYVTDYVLYHINVHVIDKLVELTIKCKEYFNLKDSYIIDAGYYKDLECEFKDLGIDVSKLINKIVLSSRYPESICNSHKRSKRSNTSVPSRLMVVLKKPKKDIPTMADRFII